MSRGGPMPRPTARFAGTLLAILATFRVFDVTLGRLARLPAAAYEEGIFLDAIAPRAWRLLSGRVPWWLALGCVAALVLVAVADARRLRGEGRRRVAAIFAGWDDVEEGRALRGFVLAVTGVAAWALACYPRNLYFDQLHLADRLIVVVTWGAIAWRPAFVLPFALACLTVGGQFTVPLGFISWTEMGVVLRFPVLFGAFWVVRAVSRDRGSDAFMVGWCCLLAATYWTSGLGKLGVDWLLHPYVWQLLLGAYANGWLAFLNAETVAHVADWVRRFVGPLMLFTLVVECGALVLLWRRWTLVGFLVLATLFHLGAFALTGILFWKWVTIDAFLLVYLLRDARLSRLRVFTRRHFALSVAAIATTPLWAPSENLTWFDTPLTYSLRFEGHDARGVVYPLPAGFFRPYGEAVVLGTFAAISPHVQLTRAMGVTNDRRVAESLEQARSAGDVFALERALGRVRFDRATAAAFDDFVARHADNARCAREREPFALRPVGAPRHLWTSPLDASIPCGTRLVKVKVFELTTWFDGEGLRLIRRRLLREVEAASPGRGVQRTGLSARFLPLRVASGR